MAFLNISFCKLGDMVSAVIKKSTGTDPHMLPINRKNRTQRFQAPTSRGRLVSTRGAELDSLVPLVDLAGIAAVGLEVPQVLSGSFGSETCDSRSGAG